MKLTSVLRALKFETPWWRPKGMIFFTVSAFEQHPFKLTSQINRISNLSRRIQDKAFIFFPPWVAGYCFYAWMMKENARLNRKQPCQFIYPEDKEILYYGGEKEVPAEESGTDSVEGSSTESD